MSSNLLLQASDGSTQKAARDALMGTLLRTYPPMLEPIQNILRMLAAAPAQHIEPTALESFRNNIATIQKGLVAWRGSVAPWRG
jgi:hypothetical protein